MPSSEFFFFPVMAALAAVLGCAGQAPPAGALRSRARPALASQADLAEAYRALDAGRVDEALLGFDALLAADPAHMRALVGAGLAHLAKGEGALARPLLDRAEARLEAETGREGRPVLVLPATQSEIDIGVDYIPYGIREKGGYPGNVAVLFPDNTLGHVLLEPRGVGWAPLRWLGMTPFTSAAGTMGRVDEAGTMWVVRPHQAQDLRIGAYARGSLSPDGSRLYACNKTESVFVALPEGKVIGRRGSGCVGRDVYWHVAWSEGGTLLFESARRDNEHSSDAARLVVSAVPSFEPVFEDDHAVLYGSHEPSGRMFVTRRNKDDRDIVLVDARQRKILVQRSGWVGSVAFRPDGAKVGLDGSTMAIVDLSTGQVEELGKGSSASIQVPGIRSTAPHFTNDGRYCVQRHERWRLHVAPSSAPRSGPVELCFPHEDGSATVVPVPVTQGFALPGDKWDFNDFMITESLGPDRKTAAIIEQAEEEKKPATGGYVVPARFLRLVDVPSGATRRRIPLGRFIPQGNGTFLLGPAFSEDGKVVTVPTSERGVTHFHVETGEVMRTEPAPALGKRPRSPHEIALTESSLPHVDVEFDQQHALFVDQQQSTATLRDLAQATVLRTERRPGLCFAEITDRDFEFATCDLESDPPRSKLFLRSGAHGTISLPMKGMVFALSRQRVAMGTKEGITIFARKKDELQELQKLPLMFGALAFSERGDHLVAAGIGFGGPGSLSVLTVPGGDVRFQDGEKSCFPLQMHPGDVIQCGSELLDLDGSPAKRPQGSQPIVLSIDHHGREMTVDEGGGKPSKRALDAFLWVESTRYFHAWSVSADGRLLFVAHNHGIVTIHAMEGGARRAVLVPTRDGSVAFLPGGTVEIEGKPPPNLACRFGDVLVPFEVCAERRTVAQGLARAMAADSPQGEP